MWAHVPMKSNTFHIWRYDRAKWHRWPFQWISWTRCILESNESRRIHGDYNGSKRTKNEYRSFLIDVIKILVNGYSISFKLLPRSSRIMERLHRRRKRTCPFSCHFQQNTQRNFWLSSRPRKTSPSQSPSGGRVCLQLHGRQVDPGRIPRACPQVPILVRRLISWGMGRDGWRGVTEYWRHGEKEWILARVAGATGRTPLSGILSWKRPLCLWALSATAVALIGLPDRCEFEWSSWGVLSVFDWRCFDYRHLNRAWWWMRSNSELKSAWIWVKWWRVSLKIRACYYHQGIQCKVLKYFWPFPNAPSVHRSQFHIPHYHQLLPYSSPLKNKENGLDIWYINHLVCLTKLWNSTNQRAAEPNPWGFDDGHFAVPSKNQVKGNGEFVIIERLRQTKIVWEREK